MNVLNLSYFHNFIIIEGIRRASFKRKIGLYFFFHIILVEFDEVYQIKQLKYLL
jgi:hypothetical protein